MEVLGWVTAVEVEDPADDDDTNDDHKLQVDRHYFTQHCRKHWARSTNIFQLKSFLV